MENKKEKVFAEGIFFNRPHEKAPDFVKGKISVDCKKFYAFMKEHVNPAGYVNLDLKVSKGGKLYLELDSWTKTVDTAKEESIQIGEATKKQVEEISADSIPF